MTARNQGSRQPDASARAASSPAFDAHQERPSRIPWPPIVYVTALALGTALHVFAPLPWFGRPFGDILLAVGALGLGAGLLLDIAAFRTLARGRTTVLPHKGSAHLVTGGPFAFTRNPIYLGNTLLCLSIGLMAGIAWLLPLAFAAAFATQKLAIEPEERHLERRFGKAFRDYAKRVRRWI